MTKHIKQLPCADLLRKQFAYFQDDGRLYCRQLGRFVGAKSGPCLLVYCFGGRHRLHRVAWSIVHGRVPDGMEIDHVDGDPMNNSLKNLRLCTARQNIRNQAESKANTSGKRGLNFDKQTGKWRVRISGDDGEISLGRFANLQDAIAARDAAEIEIFGEFRRDIS